MSFFQKLESAGNTLCLGLDPVPERIPKSLGSGVEGAERFLRELLVLARSENLLPSTLKPNLAYFEQYGWRGWRLLETLVEEWSAECTIILDAKRGDIGRSSTAYASAMFHDLKGDAVTLHPWMGPDSVAPFLAHAPQKGAYLLLRTSNPGGDVLQSDAWKNLFLTIDEWDPEGFMGFVVGATKPEELRWVLQNNKKERPLLIPGVGSQGGSAEKTVALLRKTSQPLRHRVNVSSGILYAHESGSFPESNLKALSTFSKALSP